MMNIHVVLYRKMLAKLQPYNILVYSIKYVHIFCCGYINIFLNIVTDFNRLYSSSRLHWCLEIAMFDAVAVM